VTSVHCCRNVGRYVYTAMHWNVRVTHKIELLSLVTVIMWLHDVKKCLIAVFSWISCTLNVYCATCSWEIKLTWIQWSTGICMFVVSVHMTSCLEIQICFLQPCVPNERQNLSCNWKVFLLFILGYFTFWPWKALLLQLICYINAYLSV
jgi:hypothetical protein